MPHHPTRRRFLKSATALAASPMIVPAHVLGAATDQPAPSEKLTIGLIGPGKQGTSHLAALLRRSDVRLLGICDVQEERRKAARELVERAAGDPQKNTSNPDETKSTTANSPWATPDGQMASGKTGTTAADVKYYSDYRELLARPDIDAVFIVTPDHWHANMAIEACRCGKDIYLEKPLTLTIRESREVTSAVRRYNRVLQVGSQQRSSREFRFAAEMVRSGRIGKLQQVWVVIGTPSIECDLPAEPVRAGVDWDMWLGPAPYRPFNKILCPPVIDPAWAMWRLYRDFSGGAMTDFGAHHFDIAQWAMNTDDTGPVEILPPEPGRYLTYKYASGVEVIHANTQETFGGKGLVFVGSEGKIDVDRGKLITHPSTLKLTTIGPAEAQLYRSPGHHEDFFRAVRSRKDPICPVEVGARSVSVCHLGNICYWLNRPLKWDPVKEEFIGDAEANRWVDRPKRAPWTV